MKNSYAKGQDRHLQSKAIAKTISSPSEVEKVTSECAPVYIRLPKTGERCAWTGMSRGSLNDLILGAEAPVKSVVIRQSGASRGIRLIHLPSLLDHLGTLMEKQNGSTSTDAGNGGAA